MSPSLEQLRERYGSPKQEEPEAFQRAPEQRARALAREVCAYCGHTKHNHRTASKTHPWWCSPMGGGCECPGWRPATPDGVLPEPERCTHLWVNSEGEHLRCTKPHDHRHKTSGPCHLVPPEARIPTREALEVVRQGGEPITVSHARSSVVVDGLPQPACGAKGHVLARAKVDITCPVCRRASCRVCGGSGYARHLGANNDEVVEDCSCQEML